MTTSNQLSVMSMIGVTVVEWSCALNKKHGEEQSEKKNYITKMVHRFTDRYAKFENEPQESSRGPGGQGPSANLSSPIPVPHGGSDHGRLPQEGVGWP